MHNKYKPSKRSNAKLAITVAATLIMGLTGAYAETDSCDTTCSNDGQGSNPPHDITFRNGSTNGSIYLKCNDPNTNKEITLEPMVPTGEARNWSLCNNVKVKVVSNKYHDKTASITIDYPSDGAYTCSDDGDGMVCIKWNPD